MKGVPVLAVLNGALIWKTVVSGIGWYALAAERCPLTLRRAVYGYRKTATITTMMLLVLVLEIRASLAMTSGFCGWVCSLIWSRNSSFMFRESVALIHS